MIMYDEVSMPVMSRDPIGMIPQVVQQQTVRSKIAPNTEEPPCAPASEVVPKRWRYDPPMAEARISPILGCSQGLFQGNMIQIL